MVESKLYSTEDLAVFVKEDSNLEEIILHMAYTLLREKNLSSIFFISNESRNLKLLKDTKMTT